MSYVVTGHIARSGMGARRSCLGGLGQEREAADPDALWLDDGDAAVRKRIGKGREVAEEERSLLRWAALRAAAKEDHRGFRGSPCCEQRPEVRVSGDDDSFLVGRPIEYRLVGGRLEPVVAHVNRVMASAAQLLGNARRQRVAMRNFNRLR